MKNKILVYISLILSIMTVSISAISLKIKLVELGYLDKDESSEVLTEETITIETDDLESVSE